MRCDTEQCKTYNILGRHSWAARYLHEKVSLPVIWVQNVFSVPGTFRS